VFYIFNNFVDHFICIRWTTHYTWYGILTIMFKTLNNNCV
jgi:hypothetical protein